MEKINQDGLATKVFQRYRRLLQIDFLQKILGIASFTIFVSAIYKETHHSSDIGWMSLATFLPSLMMTVFAGPMTARLSPTGLLRWLSLARVGLFLSVAVAGSGSGFLLIAAAVHSLIHQGFVSAKMSLDARLVAAEYRTGYLSQKTLLGNTAMVFAPALGGALMSLLPAWVTFAIMAFGASVLACQVFKIPKEVHSGGTSARRDSVSMFQSVVHLSSIPGTAAVVLVYCLMAMILELQAPLLFPFVREIYGKGSAFAGLLLGLCGMGGIVGSLLGQSFLKKIEPRIIPPLIILDGLLFLLFTQTYSSELAGLIFIILGAMSAITLIVVEGSIQKDVHSSHQPFVFATMQFAGGAGGASLGVMTGFIADQRGAKVVLAGAAGVEIILGLSLTIISIYGLRRFFKVQVKN